MIDHELDLVQYGFDKKDWDGRPLSESGEVAVVILGAASLPRGPYPSPIIAAACVGEVACIVEPDRLGEFLEVHRMCRLVCETSEAFHGTLEGHLEAHGDRERVRHLREFSKSGRLYDVILMDQLLDLARLGVEKGRGKLGELARAHCGLSVPTMDEVNAVIGQATESDRRSLRIIAVELARALLMVYQAMGPAVDAIVRNQHLDDPCDWLGPLSLGVQVQGDIVLGHATRRGLAIIAVNDLIATCQAAYLESSEHLLADPDLKKCYQIDSGNIKLNKSKGIPVESDGKRLLKWLEECVGQISGRHGLSFRGPWSGPNKLAKSSVLWGELAAHHEGLAAWERLWTAASALKSLEVVRGEREPSLRPNYQTLPRILSTSPSIESLRRICPGPLFKPPEGHSMVVGELCDLELRCLADRHLEGPDGEGVMARLFEQRKDPIRYAATKLCFLNDDSDDHLFECKFDELERDDPAAFLAWMTIAKDVIHMTPRGLSRQFIAQASSREIGEATAGLSDSTISRSYRIIWERVFPEFEPSWYDQTGYHLTNKLSIQHQKAFVEFGRKDEGGKIHLRGVIAGEKTVSGDTNFDPLGPEQNPPSSGLRDYRPHGPLP